MSVILCIIIAASPAVGIPLGVSVYAASFSDINLNSVFLKQHTSVTCTLASAAMIMRRTAIIAGYSDWEEITESNIRNEGWVDGIGLLWNFSCYNMTIGHGYFSGPDNKNEMLELLEAYPQGIVVYNGGNEGQSHAVILTDYDKATDTFYVADPSSRAPVGRIKMADSTIIGETQNEQIENLTSYWFVSSPLVKLENGVYSSLGGGSSSSGPSGLGAYNPDSDAALFNSTKSSENKYYVVSEDSSKGLALRYYPSGSSDAVKYVHKGTILYITYIGKNNFGALWAKTSDGYYIFTGNITTFEKYSAEIKKFGNTSKKAEGTYAVKALSDSRTALRLEPSEGNNIVGYADNGDRLYVTDSGVNSAGALWLRINEGYYVKAHDMEFLSASKLSSCEFDGKLLSVSGQYSSSPVPDSGSGGEDFPLAFRITASALNMRESPVDGDIIISIPKNETVYITEISGGWGKLEYKGKIGWISLEYAEKVSEKAPVTIESMKLSADRIETGGEIECTVTVSGGRNYFYKFSVYNETGASVYSDDSYKASRTFKYTPRKSGIYYFSVDVTDSLGEIISGYSGSFTVYDKLQIISVMTSADEYIYTFDDVSWTVETSDKYDGVVYHYSLYLDGKLIHEEESEKNEFFYTPEKPGSYILKVYLSDGVSESEQVSAAAVIVYDVLSISAIRLSAVSFVIGDEVVCSVSALGGTGSYSYCFSVFKNGSLIRNGSFSNNSEYHYTFESPGTYSMFCAVTDSGNMIVSSFSAEINVENYILGDADLNGVITSSDARLALRHSANIQKLSKTGSLAADINSDGTVTASDARAILRIAAKLD